ncbi:tetratricopeptide repeat protein [Asanoa sp. WMMD1127]|uniref:tetratricopeptide repeat protein n=1 Tax=Asanoa sp. WMMD1127 TaxID=3016107 RepID=UPI0024169346|nr:tetratricopeptide repeat protein [Asanoa sp. WMMD1127]MDG4826640.1 tetratricopeptide repeat protein [Asanoa sp. WMMD1127]
MSLPSPLAAALRQAQALRDAGDLPTARAMLEDAVDAARPVLGDDHPELLGGQHALATLHREADDPTAARRVLEEALAAGELHRGEADPLLLALSYDLGAVAEELGNRHEARRNFTRVTTYGPAAFGEDHHMVRSAAAYLSSAGGELPPLPPLQPTVAPPPPGGPAFGAPSGDAPFAAGRGPKGRPTHLGEATRDAPPRFAPSAGPPTSWPPQAPPAERTGASTTGAPAWPGREVAPGVFAPGQADAAARAAIEAPTQALPTQRPPGGQAAPAAWFDANATPESPPGPWGPPPSKPAGAAWGGGPPAGATEPWGREVAPAGDRLPTALGNRHEPAASPATAVEVAPVSLHGPMAAAAARERARGRSATVAAFVAAGAAVVLALVVLFVVFRRETEPPRVGAVPDISAGAPVPSGPALGGEPPSDLAVRADGDALLVTWTDPTAGTVPFILAAGRAGTQLRAMATIEPGVTRYLANGLSTKADYCFTVVAVYSTDKYAASGQVCTNRTADAPR